MDFSQLKNWKRRPQGFVRRAFISPRDKRTPKEPLRTSTGQAIGRSDNLRITQHPRALRDNKYRQLATTTKIEPRREGKLHLYMQMNTRFLQTSFSLTPRDQKGPLPVRKFSPFYHETVLKNMLEVRRDLKLAKELKLSEKPQEIWAERNIVSRPLPCKFSRLELRAKI